MAAPTIIPLSTLVTNAEILTNWSVGAVDTDSKVQGAGCIGAKSSAATVDFLYNYSGVGSFNFSAGGADFGKHIYVWLNCLTPTLDTQVNGGLGILVGDGTNTGVWYVGGSDLNYAGGWKCFCIDPSKAFNAIVAGTWTTTGNPAQLTAVNRLGGRIKTSATIMGNFNNALIDAIRVGTGLRLTGGDTSNPGTFDSFVTADEGTNLNRYGVVKKQAGIIIVQGKLEIGAPTGSLTTYFADQGKLLAFDEGVVRAHGTGWHNVYSETFHEIKGQGSSSIMFGTGSGTGNSIRGISGIVIKSANTGSRFSLNFTSSVTTASMYGLTTFGPRLIEFGASGSIISGSLFKLVDCLFDGGQKFTLNVETGSAAPTVLRNKIVNPISSAIVVSGSPGLMAAAVLQDSGSIQMWSPTILSGGQISSILGYGFSSLNTTITQSFTVINHDFGSDFQFVRIFPNKTWNIINPSWTVITSSATTQLNFAGTTSGTGSVVNEKYSLDVLAQTAGGQAISGAVIYVYEGTRTKNLPTENQALTNVSGAASSYITTRIFNTGSTNLNVTQSGDFALKSYYYGKVPFASSITVNQALAPVVTLIVDTNVDAVSASTAIINGEAGGSSISPIKHGIGQIDPRPLRVLHYSGGAGTIPSVSQKISGTLSTAAGSVVEVVYGDNVAAYLVLSGCSAVEFYHNETLGNADGWSAYSDLSGAAESFFGKYTWELDCKTKTLQTAYDYDRAQTATAPVFASSSWKNTIIWGEDEQTNLLYAAGNNSFFTERNVNLGEGVWASNTGGGTVSYFTSDSGSQFIPPTTVTFELTGLELGSEIKIYNVSTNELLSGIETTASDTFTYQYIYTGSDITAYAVIFNLAFKEIRLTNILLSTTNQSIPVQQQIDRVYSG